MRASVDLPFHRDREHLPAEDRQQISSREKTVAARTERRVGIMRRRWRNDCASNFRPATDRRFVFVRHFRAFEYAHEIVSSVAPAATRHAQKHDVDLTIPDRAEISRKEG